MSEPAAEFVTAAAPQSASPLCSATDADAACVVQIGQWTALPGSPTATDSDSAHRAGHDLLGKLLSAPSRAHAAAALADEVRAWGDFSRVAIGLCRSPGKPCRLAAVSGSPDFDRRTELARHCEAVLDEAVLRKTAAAWSSNEESRHRATAAQKTLCRTGEASCVASAPLIDFDGRAVGALVCLGADSTETALGALAGSGILQPQIAACLNLLPSRTRNAARPMQSWRGWKGAAVLLGSLLVACSLAIPLPYKVSCHCSMQPVIRRFIAAPFAARLEAVMAEPGDLVSKGQVLAKLDGREIRWELAGLTADLDRAAKARDA
ncbi:MAG: biotin/lipoyl-binding protein, partial [Pirellulales bacterium]|nr:biotin/lipoyl-binding protein [Pirellulales bacterium]